MATNSAPNSGLRSVLTFTSIKGFTKPTCMLTGKQGLEWFWNRHGYRSEEPISATCVLIRDDLYLIGKFLMSVCITVQEFYGC